MAREKSGNPHLALSNLRQDEDVFDTWFSSWLWPVSVFDGISRPDNPDIQYYYPTNDLVTAPEILFFWVARMIMLGCWFMQDIPMPDGTPRPIDEIVPFREVYIHALVRDADRQKMSKTKGNVIDPVEIVNRYGTDAVRFTLASMASPGTDIAFNEARTEGYRAFANKIWNAARFIFMNVDRAREAGIEVDPAALGEPPTAADDAPLEMRWIAARTNSVAAEINATLGEYRFHEAANLVYQFFWGDFCDWYLEIVKLRLDFSDSANKSATKAALTLLLQTFESALRLLSPFMPFLTEELWHALYNGNPPAKSIALTRYPQGAAHSDDPAESAFALLQELIVAVRALRKDLGVEEKAAVPVRIKPLAPGLPFAQNLEIIQRLARVSAIETLDSLPDGLPVRATPRFDVQVLYEKKVDTIAERERLTKELARYEKEQANANRQLSNESFLSKAPAAVVEGLRRRAAELEMLLDKTRKALEDLK